MSDIVEAPLPGAPSPAVLARLAEISIALDVVDDTLDAVCEGATAVRQLELLERLDHQLAAVRTEVADTRAVVIAGAAAADGSSARKAAAELGLSVAAVSKAQARARALPAS